MRNFLFGLVIGAAALVGAKKYMVPAFVDQQYTVTIASSLAQTSTSPLPSGKVGTAYNTVLTASGGVSPYTWSISAGALPAGLTIASTTGTIGGNPTAVGTFTFTARVTDSAP